MTGHRSIVLDEAIKILSAHGEWMDYDELTEKLLPLVPPGRAIRQAEKGRRASSGTSERMVQRSESQLIRIGAREIVRTTLYSSNKFEINDRSRYARNRLIRYNPGFGATYQENYKLAVKGVQKRTEPFLRVGKTNPPKFPFQCVHRVLNTVYYTKHCFGYLLLDSEKGLAVVMQTHPREINLVYSSLRECRDDGWVNHAPVPQPKRTDVTRKTEAIDGKE